MHAPRRRRASRSEGDGDVRQDDHLGCRDLCAQQPNTLSQECSGSKSGAGRAGKGRAEGDDLVGAARAAVLRLQQSLTNTEQTGSAAVQMTTQLGRGEGGDGRGWRMSRMRRWILSGRPPPSRTRGPCLSSGPCRRPGQSAPSHPEPSAQLSLVFVIAWLCLRLRRAPCLAGSARCSRPGASAASTSAPQPPQQAVSTALHGRAQSEWRDGRC